MTPSQILDRPLLLFAILAVASAMILAAAFAFQYIGGFDPCVLCIWQRYPYGVVIVLGVAGAALARGGGTPRSALTAIMGLAALTLFTDAAIAGFHVGVEQKWWQGTAACVGATGADGIEALRAQLLAQKVVRCDEVAWSLGGISMAGYNMVAALALGIAAALGTARMARPRPPSGGTDG